MSTNTPSLQESSSEEALEKRGLLFGLFKDLPLGRIGIRLHDQVPSSVVHMVYVEATHLTANSHLKMLGALQKLGDLRRFVEF